MSTRLRIIIEDKNDHLPRFIQPVRELNQTFEFSLAYSKLDDYALVQLKASDLDASDKFALVKYSIVDNRLVERHNPSWCVDLVNLTIYLDETNGWLYVGRSGNVNADLASNSRRWCEVEFRLRAVAVNYMAEDNEVSELVEFGLILRVFSSSPLSDSTFTWIIREQFDWQSGSQPVATYLDSSPPPPSPDPLQIDKCWRVDATTNRRKLSPDEFYVNLRWPDLFVYAKEEVSRVSRLECRLVDLKSSLLTGMATTTTTTVSNQRLNAWLVIDMRPVFELPESLPQTVVYFEIDRQRIVRDNSHLNKFNHIGLIEADLQELMLVYKLADSNEDLIQKVN